MTFTFVRVREYSLKRPKNYLNHVFTITLNTKAYIAGIGKSCVVMIYDCVFVYITR